MKKHEKWWAIAPEIKQQEYGIFDRQPDVEVLFAFNGTRKYPSANGYRPAHRVKEDYLTTGVHQYYDTTTVPPNGTAKGTITFITPQAYPHCLWQGKTITIQEGGRIVGIATVLKVLNKDLEMCNRDSEKHTTECR